MSGYRCRGVRIQVILAEHDHERSAGLRASRDPRRVVSVDTGARAPDWLMDRRGVADGRGQRRRLHRVRVATAFGVDVSRADVDGRGEAAAAVTWRTGRASHTPAARCH